MQAGAFFPKGAVMTNQEIFELMARFDASTATTRIYTMESGLIHARQIEQLGLLVT